ncbi:MAG: sigma-70 family RNA polymerase sigma factor [Phycisphaerae bacterium]
MTQNHYRSRWIAGLADQLLRGPKRFRLQQLLNIEFLLSVVRVGKQYPTDFVQNALTGRRPTATPRDVEADGLLSGAALREDLALLADELSDNASLSPTAYIGTLFTVEELAERFDVSTKTIFRWRRRGLVGWKFRADDHRTRVYFADRCVRRFVAENTKLVSRGSSFSQLTAKEREAVIKRAEKLVGGETRTANAVAKQIADETGRAVETIRLILKAYDEAHPGAGVFNRELQTVAPDDKRLAIWSAYHDGATIDELVARFEKPAKFIYRAITQMRAVEKLRDPIDFIPSEEFARSDANDMIMSDEHTAAPYRTDNGKPSPSPANLPPYLQQLFRLPLLSAEGERALFRKMNFLRYKAEQLRASLNSDKATAAQLDQIDAYLEDADRVKNQITRANLRLVVSIAKRHITANTDFFEIISDGNISLMRAVDKFDYSRGFKFSTYASWAIIKNFARSVPEERTHKDRYQTGRDEFLESISMPQFAEHEDEQRSAARTALEKMFNSLDERDREILRRRFGIDNHGDPETLEQIGNRLGVSKERVRQLESRAMNRLREEFSVDVESFFAN